MFRDGIQGWLIWPRFKSNFKKIPIAGFPYWTFADKEQMMRLWDLFIYLLLRDELWGKESICSMTKWL